MFKKSLLALSLVAVSTTAAFAAPTANIIVNGTITPPTCTIDAEDEINLTYTFDVSPGLFPASGNLTTIPAQSQPLTVTCDATTFLAFDVTDTKANTALTVSATNFGLGTYGADNVGFYTITMRNAKVKADPSENYTNATIYTTASWGATAANLTTIQTFGWSMSNALAPAQVFNADFEVKPTLNGALKNSAGDAQLDGLAILAFKFGI